MDVRVGPIRTLRAKNWCFQTVVLERILRRTLDSNEIKPVNPLGNQPWIFIGRTDAEVEAPILWTTVAKSQFIGKDPDAGKIWGQEEKGMTEDEMVGWYYRLMGMSLSKFQEIVKDKEAWRAAVHRVTESDMTDWKIAMPHYHMRLTSPILFLSLLSKCL